MRRRTFLKTVGSGAAGLVLHGCTGRARTPLLRSAADAKSVSRHRRPNVLLILADDLGYGELGCYGQRRIETPNIDRLAAEGMRFTQHYSGSPVCAPTRCCLLTGKHTGHAYIRDNKEMGGWKQGDPEGQLALPADTMTLARVLSGAGYATCGVGKWGLGGPDSTGHPNRQGFDHWYGYLCQRQAHNYYPTHLWRNGERDVLSGNEYFSAHQRIAEPPEDIRGYARYQGEQYAPDLMIEEALQFVRAHARAPFFLYFATPVPHVALQVPDDSLARYLGRWPEKPYLGEKGYLPHPAPRAAYAAMITRMDRDVGRLLDGLRALGLEEDTLVLFSSDNGPTFAGGVDASFFESAGPLRGLKCDLYEGAIRVPLIARWPGRIAAGGVSDHVSALWDVLPTVTDAVGVDCPANIDGVSLMPTLVGQRGQGEPDHLYWEYRARGGGQAVRLGRWKGLRLNLKEDPARAIELYDLAADVGETIDVAALHPNVVERIASIMRDGRTPSAEFPLPSIG